MTPKYVLYIDFKASGRKPLSYRDLKAKDLYEAIEEADTYFGEDIYLLKICEKYGRTRREGARFTNYKAILCKRSVSGWHLNNADNGEGHVMLRRWEFTGSNPFTEYEIL